MNTQKIKEADTEISFYDEGNGKPIVLIHGFAGGKEYWDKILPDLAKENRVIALDLPGHGGTGMGKEGYSIEDMARFIKDFLDQLGIENVTMFGHSLGGYITLAFAELYPQYLNGFSLVHSTANADTDEAKKGRDTNSGKIQEEGPGTFIEGLSKKLFSPENLELNMDEITDTVKIGLKTSVKGLVSAMSAMKNRLDRNYVLQETELPVLLVAGELDQIVPPEKTFTVDKPNIHKYIIKNSGHMSMYEQPKDLLRAMNEFLAKL
ncbi:alpha/beta fold hydrolase [Bacillus sp. ISL-35]|uniref:alpha/beta fold hydrolase n=1 Tax=Bacillus sp. ISL-35 TaxID=2819122 RepID=UPI001BE70EA6|nr:alpha/beta fold hydrolase [Bacillus sp. ISL-35]MBT2679532.1 alpha/beta fold hydrolase [Bacillus sp. ISL-35]MBT2703435.1 alpha/beta fold hydrolase [Chryseobacterium sp. ISL-80]